MAKLTKQDWQEARKIWESDPRDGHQWLADELVKKGFEVSRANVAMAAKRQEWSKQKVTKNVIGNVTKVTKNVTKKTAKNVSETGQPEWEEVTEDEVKRHGNSLYREEFNELAYEYSLAGATDEILADAFEVSTVTLNAWKKKHPLFLISITRGKFKADSKMVSATYLSGVGGHYIEEEKIVGDQVIFLKRQIPPDVKAQQFWLKNRMPHLFRDKQEIATTHTIDKELLESIKQTRLERLERARDRQMQVLIRRGIIKDNGQTDNP